MIFAPARLTFYNLLISGVLTFWQAVATYAHLQWLLGPRFRKKISLVIYAVGILPLIVLASLGSWGNLYLVFRFLLGEGAAGNFIDNTFEYWQGSILGGMTMAVAFTGAIYLFGRRREQEKREQQLEKARTEAELAYLRGQLNPHFLFNALNSIYFLIPRNPEEAQAALGGFSDLLRYQLYESESDRVSLKKELVQLRKYVDLSRLRLEEDFVFAINEPTEINNQQIPPMLLLPLVENAIKYSPSEGGRVTGMLEVERNRLRFSLTNKVGTATVEPRSGTGEATGGIGLVNIRRRLKLLYPANHTFSAGESNGHYTVHLEIPLD